MNDFLQTLQLTASEKLWMAELYEFYKRGEYVRLMHLKRKLWGKIEKDFNPEKIDNRLVKSGYQFTPLGILYIDPHSRILEKIDIVMRGLKKYIRENFKEDTLRVKYLLTELNMTPEDFVRTLALINLTVPLEFQYFFEDRFFNESGQQQKEEVLRFQSDKAIDGILFYEGIEKFVDEKILHPINDENQTVQALNLPTQIAKSPSRNGHPVFRSTVSQIDLKLCFVLMPFSEIWSERVYKDLIRKNVEELGLQCLRADNLTGQIVIEDIWIKINQCAFVIVDVTGKNPNVMYELGIVHTLGKPAILITQDLLTIPFDFKHFRHYEYQDNTDGFKNLSQKLPQVIQEIYNEYYPGITNFSIGARILNS